MDPTDASTVSIATRTTTSYALTFASWKETEKWDGRSMGKKAFKEKFERSKGAAEEDRRDCRGRRFDRLRGDLQRFD